MKALHRCLFFLAALIFLFTANLAVGASCPPSSKLEPESRACLPVVDVSAQLTGFAALPPPDLAAMRIQYNHTQPAPAAARTGLPRPGGVGTGAEYATGAFPGLTSSILYTTMTIRPDGLNPSTDGLDWVFETATNRMQLGVELVAIYFRNSPTGSIGWFDWSCSVANPCGNITSPAWISTVDFSTLSCNITKILDDGGFVHNVVRYANETVQIAAGSPPTWQNVVHLRNFCHGGWDIIYQHTYTADQHDCSDGSCAWWGPIMETFPSTTGSPFPAINALGFQSTTLVANGISTLFNSGESDASANVAFTYPNAPWTLYDLNPARDYYAGNYVDELTAAQCATWWKQFGFASIKACRNYVAGN